jgi:hypothetical protein
MVSRIGGPVVSISQNPPPTTTTTTQPVIPASAKIDNRTAGSDIAK